MVDGTEDAVGGGIAGATRDGCSPAAKDIAMASRHIRSRHRVKQAPRCCRAVRRTGSRSSCSAAPESRNGDRRRSRRRITRRSTSFGRSPQSLERFRAKWTPVRVKKTRQNKKLEPRSDSIRTEKALAASVPARSAESYGMNNDNWPVWRDMPPRWRILIVAFGVVWLALSLCGGVQADFPNLGNKFVRPGPEL